MTLLSSPSLSLRTAPDPLFSVFTLFGNRSFHRELRQGPLDFMNVLVVAEFLADRIRPADNPNEQLGIDIKMARRLDGKRGDTAIGNRLILGFLSGNPLIIDEDQ